MIIVLALAGGFGWPERMRQARLKAPEDHDVAYYHAISRVVNREFVPGGRERGQFVEMMRCRVRHFADGAALGTKKFAEAVFQKERHRSGQRRRNGAGSAAAPGGPHSLRDPRKDPIHPHKEPK